MVTNDIESDTGTTGTIVRIGWHWLSYRLALLSGLTGSDIRSGGTGVRNHHNWTDLTRLSTLTAIWGQKRWTGWRIQILQWVWLGRNWCNWLETDKSWKLQPPAKSFPDRFLSIFQPEKCTIEPSPCVKMGVWFRISLNLLISWVFVWMRCPF